MPNFQVYYPLCGGTEWSDLMAILPTGWKIELTEAAGLYNIISDTDGIVAGHLKALPKAAKINVDETTPLGLKFWQNFAMKHSWLSPFDLQYGVLYLPNGEGDLYELDDSPEHLPISGFLSGGELSEEAREFLSHYDDATAWYVSFLFGDWHNKDSIKLISRWRILEDGTLGPDEGPAELSLGDTENEETM